jgi:hypothetical protein
MSFGWYRLRFYGQTTSAIDKWFGVEPFEWRNVDVEPDIENVWRLGITEWEVCSSG